MNSRLELFRPYPTNTITQVFSENANVSYARDGLIGHTSEDYGVPYGTPIPCCADDSYCYSLENHNNPDLMRFRAVYTLVETDAGIYEISYGHCSSMTAEVGKTYKAGDIIGRIGNTGTVFTGSHEVTSAEKNAGSWAGAHLHGPQVRPVRKVTKVNRSQTYLYDQTGRLFKDGFYFEVIDYNNGLNGCVDPAPFYASIMASEAQRVKANLKAQITLLSKIVELLQKLVLLVRK